MPFRSEDEQLREQARRLDETARELLEEKADLERQIGLQHRARKGLVGFGVAALAATVLGSTAGAAASSAHAARERAARDPQQGEALERERRDLRACETSDRNVLEELASCQEELARPVRRAEENPGTPPPACRCQVGDLRCECPFDRAAAAAALGSTQAPILRCFARHRTPAAFHARLTFVGQTGRVETAALDSGSEGLSADEQQCVVIVLRAVKVPPFAGAVVSVGKSFSVVSQ